MMPTKLFSRMVTEQEQMAKAFAESNSENYQKAEAAQEKLMNEWYRDLNKEQRAEWSAVCARLDAWICAQLVTPA